MAAQPNELAGGGSQSSLAHKNSHDDLILHRELFLLLLQMGSCWPCSLASVMSPSVCLCSGCKSLAFHWSLRFEEHLQASAVLWHMMPQLSGQECMREQQREADSGGVLWSRLDRARSTTQLAQFCCCLLCHSNSAAGFHFCSHFEFLAIELQQVTLTHLGAQSDSPESC